ncbi:MAG: C-GCAxxG-C-C family protein [Candidatus Amulumruptor caecigallinarius]|nr:C-GCAxxG-C-C family protein [Candidatus Amulumruptor caecigallinarius]MCM1395895.1 C-GCAxxG-C-C family protein [Candidatus Amulumruptor caecigallinarius]MCM1452930.1 C-GCAxxG-C-C family protein [bacterium]
MQLTKSIEQRIADARRNHQQGYNCAQCVVMAFDDVASPEHLAALEAAAAPLGAGMGDMAHTCGCLSGAHMLTGALCYDGPANKQQRYKEAAAFNAEWIRRHTFSACRDLKTKGHIPCMTLIEDTISQLHNTLGE